MLSGNAQWEDLTLTLFFSKKRIYLHFKPQRNALYRCHGTLFGGKCDVTNL